MNPVAEAHNRILAGPDTPAKDWLTDHLANRKKAEEAKSPVVEPKEYVTYRCSKGHDFTEPDRRSPVGNCPICTWVNIDYKRTDGKPAWMTESKLKLTGEPIRADFDHDPELRRERG